MKTRNRDPRNAAATVAKALARAEERRDKYAQKASEAQAEIKALQESTDPAVFSAAKALILALKDAS